MTRIRYRTRHVWHETGLIDRHSGRAYVVAESPVNLMIRLKGTRQTLSLPWSMAYLRAAMLHDAERRKAKAEKRASIRRGGR